MTDESLRGIDILSEFGLTETQAKVFIAATQLVNPTVAELAEASEVRREEVYRLLPDLEKMGLIERLLGKPLRLKTPNPKSSISTLVKLEREKAKDRISELSRRSRDLLQQLDYHGSVWGLMISRVIWISGIHRSPSPRDKTIRICNMSINDIHKSIYYFTNN